MDVRSDPCLWARGSLVYIPNDPDSIEIISKRTRDDNGWLFLDGGGRSDAKLVEQGYVVLEAD